MIVLKAILGAFFAVGVTLAAIIVAAFIIRMARILFCEVLARPCARAFRWIRRGGV